VIAYTTTNNQVGCLLSARNTDMKSTKRALRRHHHERMVDKAMRIPYLHFNYYNQYDTQEELRLRARKISNHQCVCSCSACGGIRHNGWDVGLQSLTFAERRNLDSFADQMEDLDFPEDLEDNIVLWQDEKA